MKRKVKVNLPDGITVKEIVARYGVHRATAYRALKRGYLWVVKTECTPNIPVIMRAIDDRDKVKRYLERCVKKDYVEDLLQDIYEKVILSSDEVTKYTNKWLFTIAKYVVLSHRKSL